MKQSKVAALLITVVCLISLTATAFAVETRASDQISNYSMSVTAGPGTLNIEFSVRGNGRMQKLGCRSIYIYEKSGNSWSFVEDKLEDETGMSKTSSSTHANTIYCDGEAGVEYKVVVTIFAENSDGRDTRTKTFYVTGK